MLVETAQSPPFVVSGVAVHGTITGNGMSCDGACPVDAVPVLAVGDPQGRDLGQLTRVVGQPGLRGARR